MSTPRWVKSRLKNQAGFTIAAAVVSAAILTVVAIAVQMTVPATVDPRSQGAAAESTNCATNTSPPNIPGYDVLLNQSADNCYQVYYWPVCPVNGSVNPNDPILATGVYSKLTPILAWRVNSDTFPKGWGNGDSRCFTKLYADSSKKFIPNEGQEWKAGVLTCKYSVGSNSDFSSSLNTSVSATNRVATRLPGDADEGACQDIGRENSLKSVLDSKTKCNGAENPAACLAALDAKTEPAPEPVVETKLNPDEVCTKGTEEEIKTCKIAVTQGLPTNSTLDDILKQNETDKDYITKNCAEGSVVSDECTRAIERNVDTVSKLNSLAQDNQAALAKNCDVERNGVDAEYQKCTAAQKVANDNYAKISQALKNDIVTSSPDGCPLGATKDSEGNCKDAKGFIVGCNDPGGCKKGTEEKKPGNETKTPSYSGPTGTTYTSGGNNPQIGAGSGVQSPFGGACNTRYVCQGNMLYYQSQNGQQCMTQPMQQCQYGCQQVAAGQAGQTSTLGTITQLLPVVTSVMRMFGGGNTNSATTMANPNLSSSCATQQQQQQGQYGTGTNGQACTQPPQQPDPAQCTSGTWKATSAQQNGCTTGWQCVSGTGTGGTQPTAQLSCQPQVADVGMQIGFSWSCGNSSGSAGTGFDTGGQLSGNTTAIAPAPPADSSNTAVYTLTCVNQGVTASAQCQVQIGKSGVVLIANPQQVRSGETSQIGWITAGMKSCVVSSPDQNDFTQKNASTANVNGAAQSSPITKTTVFKLDCVTVGGLTKSVTTTVGVN